MTRHDVILQFASDSRTHRNHLATFHVLTEMWFSAGQPEYAELDFNELIRLLKTKRSTLFDWLKQLEIFGYVELHRSRNQHQKTTFRLYPNRTAVTEVGQQPGLLSTEVGQHVPKSDGTYPNRTAEPVLLVPQMGQHEPKSDSRDPNETAESAKTAPKRGFSELSTAAKPVLVHHHHLNNNILYINSKEVIPGDDEKGVQGKKPNVARPIVARPIVARPKAALRKRNSRPDNQKTILYTSSEFASAERLKQELGNEFPSADFDHYHARLTNWKDKNGQMKQRADWLSTARQFLLNDTHEGKLITVTPVKPLNSHANRNRSHSLIEPQPDPNRRFGTW